MLAHIMTDEQRSNRPKSARPFGVALGSPLGASQRLPGADGPALRAAPAQQASQSDHGAHSRSGLGPTR
jgi:hypothetical protein